MMKNPSVIEVLKHYNSTSRPLLVVTDDEKEYVAKPMWTKPPPNRYQLGADFVVGRLGALMTAPVAPVQVLRFHAVLGANYSLESFTPGFCHGSELLPKVVDSYQFERIDQNRERFAKLALLYGWMGASDRQYQYQRVAPYYVFSCDHGEFLSGKVSWVAGMLDPEFEPKAVADNHIVSGAGLKTDDLTAASIPLRRISDTDIVNTIASIPEEWGINTLEREALRAFLVRRRLALLEIYA